MKSSKRYQEIADSLNIIKNRFELEETSINEFTQDFLLLAIVKQLCYDFKKSNPKFKEDYFKKEIYK